MAGSPLREETRVLVEKPLWYLVAIKTRLELFLDIEVIHSENAH